jgi:methionyl-tRNA formyltransferase
MDTKFDTGDIIAQKKVKTDFSDTGKTLHKRLENAQFELFTNTWPMIESDKFEYLSQDETAGSYHTKSDFVELCDLNSIDKTGVKPLLDRLRTLTFPPFDNAYLDVDGERYYVDVDIRKADDAAETKTDGLLSSY